MITVIGDSHATLYSNVPERNRGVWDDTSLQDLFDIRWLGPYTLWRLCREQEKFIDLNSKIYYNSTGITAHTQAVTTDVMLVLGEIDMRCHIMKFDPIQKADEMTDLLCKFMTKFKPQFNLHFQSIVPTIYRENFGDKKPLFPFVGNDEERRDATLYMNKKIKEMCEANGFGYFDIFDLYADENDMMDFDKSDGIVHAMKLPELETRIREYFND